MWIEVNGFPPAEPGAELLTSVGKVHFLSDVSLFNCIVSSWSTAQLGGHGWGIRVSLRCLVLCYELWIYIIKEGVDFTSFFMRI